MSAPLTLALFKGQLYFFYKSEWGSLLGEQESRWDAAQGNQGVLKRPSGGILTPGGVQLWAREGPLWGDVGPDPTGRVQDLASWLPTACGEKDAPGTTRGPM